MQDLLTCSSFFGQRLSKLSFRGVMTYMISRALLLAANMLTTLYNSRQQAKRKPNSVQCTVSRIRQQMSDNDRLAV